MKSIYDTNKHSVYLLKYHLVLVIKHKKEIINDTILFRLKEIFEYIGKKEQYKLKILEFNNNKDHLHIIFTAEPKSELKKFINAYKSASSRLVKKEFPETIRNLKDGAFWSRSFFLATVGEVSMDDLRQYVEKQQDNNK